MRRGRRLGVAVAIVGLVALGGPWVIGRFADWMLYPAPPIAVPEPPPPPLVDRSLRDEGRTISVWEGGAPEGDPVVLWFHGNGENLETLRWSGLFDRMSELGCPLVAMDYPGYGRSSGRPGEKALVDAALRVLADLETRRAGRRVVVVGWSLGAAVGARLAAARPEAVDGLVLLSPWETLASVGRRHFPAWLVRWGVGDAWDTAAALRSVRATGAMPTLIGHGRDDRLIPVEEGRRLHAALPEARWVEVARFGHNDLLGADEVWAELEEFLAQVDRTGRALGEAG